MTSSVQIGVPGNRPYSQCRQLPNVDNFFITFEVRLLAYVLGESRCGLQISVGGGMSALLSVGKWKGSVSTFELP